MVTCWYRTAREESANIVWWQVACMLAWRPTHARARARMTACVRAHSDSAAQRRRSLADVCGSQAMNIQEDGSAVQHPLPPPAWLARCLRAHIRQVDPVPPPPPPSSNPLLSPIGDDICQRLHKFSGRRPNLHDDSRSRRHQYQGRDRRGIFNIQL